MPYYIKREVKPLEARQLTERNQAEIMEWIGGRRGLDGSVVLVTPESGKGTQIAVTGDYLVKGYTELLGWHFWPVKPDYFELNYEKVRD
ncbi:hypothetical protein [Chitinophaga sp. MM2321]|uniref:hypothetical protein n=1 Tax=Chitinophaga sp. MM2321 TaxID=3137178 RepID=UPI0032D58DE1